MHVGAAVTQEVNRETVAEWVNDCIPLSLPSIWKHTLTLVVVMEKSALLWSALSVTPDGNYSLRGFFNIRDLFWTLEEEAGHVISCLKIYIFSYFF